MTAVPKEDTLSRGGLPRDKLSQVSHRLPALSTWLDARPAACSASCDAALRAQLRTLALLRAVAGGVLLVLIAGLSLEFDGLLPVRSLVFGLALLVVANVVLLQRVRSAKTVGPAEYFGHIMFDMLWLTYTIYWLGGSAHNPFADLFIVYVGMIALVLTWRHVLIATAVAFVLYALLQSSHYELELVHSGIDQQQLETIAHQAHFVLLVCIVAYFGYRLACTSRRAGELEAQSRVQDARGEAAVNLASLAAGTAHEMGTPLTTIAMLVGEMQKHGAGLAEAERQESLRAISAAVLSCKQSLGEMVGAIGAHRMIEARPLAARQLLEQLVEKFKPMRPRVPVSVIVECSACCQVESSAPLRQALMNLVANAAEASPEGIELRLRCSPSEVEIDVVDRGPGIPEGVLDKLGTQVVTTKPAQAGNGVGVYLANMTIARLGGRLQYLARTGGGTCARVTLPTVHA